MKSFTFIFIGWKQVEHYVERADLAMLSMLLKGWLPIIGNFDRLVKIVRVMQETDNNLAEEQVCDQERWKEDMEGGFFQVWDEVQM